MLLGLDSDLKSSCPSLTQICPVGPTLNKTKMTLSEIDMGAGKVQRLSMHSALAEDLDLFPNLGKLTAACNSSSRRSNRLF